MLFVAERHHWILSGFLDGEVRIYDSLSSSTLTPTAEQQLLQLYGATMSSNDNGLVVASMPMQQQNGSCDCGIFAIAAAFHIAAGDNMKDEAFDQTKMRNHLAQCFRRKALSPFPGSRKEKVIRNALSSTFISVYCHCGRPDSFEEMIQCDACDMWFHFQCAQVETAPDDSWFCSRCTN